jgi:uncharacterized protein
MFDWGQYKGNLTWLKDRTIYLTVSGSYSYNTQVPGVSDVDIRGIAVAPKEYYLGYLNNFEHVDQKEPDFTIFDIRKFIKLASICSPNLLELLYTDPEHHLIVTKAGQKLIDNRDIFLSQLVIQTYVGYANGQLKKIKEDGFNKRLKYGLHFVRLLTMCKEILRDGKVIVKRPDAEFLLSIRQGALTYDQLIEFADKQQKELDELIKTTKLPKAPDRKAIDKLCVEIVEEML